MPLLGQILIAIGTVLVSTLGNDNSGKQTLLHPATGHREPYQIPALPPPQYPFPRLHHSCNAELSEPPHPSNQSLSALRPSAYLRAQRCALPPSSFLYWTTSLFDQKTAISLAKIKPQEKRLIYSILPHTHNYGDQEQP